MANDGQRRGLRILGFMVLAFTALGLFSYGFEAYDLLVTLPVDGIAYMLADRDFANYWVGGRLAVSGAYLDLFSHETYFPYLQQLFGADYQIRSWSYPPHYLLLVWPLGYLDYEVAFAAFMGSTFALFAMAVVAFKREFAPTVDPRLLLVSLLGYVLMMFVTTQNGFLTSALLLFGLAWMRARPWLAGIAFACLTVKPQLGVLLPVVLLLDRNWRVIVSATVATVGLIAASVVSFGVESWMAYFTDTVAYQRFVMTDWYGIFLRMMPTVFGAARTLGLGAEAAAEIQAAVSGIAGLAVLWLLSREADRLTRAFIVLCGTFLVSPYAFNYDMGALCVGAALLAGRHLERYRVSVAGPLALIAVCSPAVMNLGRAGLPLVPPLLAVGLLVLLAASERDKPWGAGVAPAGR